MHAAANKAFDKTTRTATHTQTHTHTHEEDTEPPRGTAVGHIDTKTGRPPLPGKAVRQLAVRQKRAMATAKARRTRTATKTVATVAAAEEKPATATAMTPDREGTAK